MSATLLYLQTEALPVWFELRMQRRQVRTDHVRRISELPIPVGLVVLQVPAHGRLGVGAEGHGAAVVESPNNTDRVGREVRVTNVVDARVVDQGVAQGRMKTGAARRKVHSRLLLPVHVAA